MKRIYCHTLHNSTFNAASVTPTSPVCHFIHFVNFSQAYIYIYTHTHTLSLSLSFCHNKLSGMTHPISTLHLQEALSQLKSSQLISMVLEPTVTKFQGITAHSMKQNSKEPMCPKRFWRDSKIIKDKSIINSSTIKRHTGFQASDTQSMRTAFFWVITQHVVVTPLLTFLDNLWVPSSRIPGMKKGPTGHPETSVSNCHSPLCNNPGECSSHYQVVLHTNIPTIYCNVHPKCTFEIVFVLQ